MSKQVDWANLPKSDVELLAEHAVRFVAAHERRNQESKHATLSEADAIFNLRFAFKQIEER